MNKCPWKTRSSAVTNPDFLPYTGFLVPISIPIPNGNNCKGCFHTQHFWWWFEFGTAQKLILFYLPKIHKSTVVAIELKFDFRDTQSEFGFIYLWRKLRIRTEVLLQERVYKFIGNRIYGELNIDGNHTSVCESFECHERSWIDKNLKTRKLIILNVGGFQLLLILIEQIHSRGMISLHRFQAIRVRWFYRGEFFLKKRKLISALKIYSVTRFLSSELDSACVHWIAWDNVWIYNGTRICPNVSTICPEGWNWQE